MVLKLTVGPTAGCVRNPARYQRGKLSTGDVNSGMWCKAGKTQGAQTARKDISPCRLLFLDEKRRVWMRAYRHAVWNYVNVLAFVLIIAAPENISPVRRTDLWSWCVKCFQNTEHVHAVGLRFCAAAFRKTPRYANGRYAFRRVSNTAETMKCPDGAFAYQASAG